MAILSGLLSLLSRKLSDVLQALFGWSIRGLFGRLPDRKETALLIALILSMLWPALVVGCFVPKVAAWLVAFVPLHEWLGQTFLRALWIVLAVLSPIAVGGIVSWVAPTRRQQGSLLRTILSGYPLTVGIFLSFLLTFFIVPALKVHALARRWEDEHVYVQVKENGYHEVLLRIAAACAKTQTAVRLLPVPGTMAAPVRVLTWFAKSAIAPILASDPKMLRGDGIEIYLYPTDVLLRGRPERVRRVRAEIVRELMAAPAYLTQDDQAQKLEAAINRTWEFIEEHRGMEELRGNVKNRIRLLAAELDRASVPFEDWVLLYNNVQRLDREVASDSVIKDAAPVVEQAVDGLAAVVAKPSMAALVKLTFDETRNLLLDEIALARDEARRQLTAVKRALAMFGAALVMALVGLSTLLLALVLFVDGRPLMPAILGGGFLVTALLFGLIGYALLRQRSRKESRPHPPAPLTLQGSPRPA